MARSTLVVLTSLVLSGIALSGCESGGDTVGPRGGTIVSDDGRFSVEIRPGALEDDVAITIAEAECGSMVGPCYEVSPAGVGFLFPAKVTFELEGEMHDGVPVDDLALIVSRGTEWTVLADRVIDHEDGTLSGSAVYLSSFAVAEMH